MAIAGIITSSIALIFLLFVIIFFIIADSLLYGSLS